MSIHQIPIRTTRAPAPSRDALDVINAHSALLAAAKRLWIEVAFPLAERDEAAVTAAWRDLGDAIRKVEA